MTVFWLDFAQNKLEDIHDYYCYKANKKIADKIVLDIINSTINLQKHPELGQIDPLLQERKEQFRFIIVSHHKIIYWINSAKKRIEIITVFDTRQNPQKLLETVSL